MARSLLFLVLLLGCGAELQPPEAVLVAFLDLMDRANTDPTALAEAFALLDQDARRALQARADRARSLSSGAYAAHEMLVPGRFRLRFTPRERGGMRARVQGKTAIVEVLGARGERAQVPLRREPEGWRLALPGLGT